MRKEIPQFQDDDCRAARSFSAVSRHFSYGPGDLVLHPSSTPRSPSAEFSHKGEIPYLVQWLQSGGNLDFCVLALCSCILTVLCHQTPVLSPTSTASQNAAPPAATQPSEVDLAIKAGLFTTIKGQSESEGEELESGDA
jgi:hypothetical protein